MLAMGSEVRYRLAALFEAHWEEFVRTYRRRIRAVVFETVRRICACRMPALGCHLYQCPKCQRVEVVPHSCKSRFCPTCGKHATDRWADGVLNDLLDVPYHHVVLSVPAHLRGVFAFNRPTSLSLLFRAAADALNQWAREVHGMRLGMVLVLHTFGGDLKWHPHLHLLVTEGGLSLDGKRWVRPYGDGWLMAHGGLKKMWRYHVIRALRRAHRAGELRFPDSAAFLADYPRFNALLQRLYQMTWYAHIGASLRDPGFTLRYIGRYTKRAVLAEYRITHYDPERKTVRFAFQDYAQGGKTSFKTLPVLAFLGRLIQHIPDKHFKMVRYAGLFATRHRAHYLEHARAVLGQEDSTTPAEPEPTPTSHLDWRERRQAEGTDPLLCPRCEIPMVFVRLVFGPHEPIAELFRAAGKPVAPTHPIWDTG
jgi:hypothetical protein